MTHVIAKRMLIGGMVLPFLVTPSLAQGTVAQRVACTGDAFKFCGSAIPDIPAIISCMGANYAQFTPACQAQFPRAQGRKRREPS